MKKKKRITLLIFGILSALLLVGCSDDSAEKYVGEKITSMKKEDTKEFTALLESGIAKSNEQYVLQFPEELRKPYLTFLQSAFSNISFEVSAAEKWDSTHYTVKLTFAPIDIAASVEESDSDYLKTLTDPDLTAAVTALLTKDAQTIKANHVYSAETFLTIDILKEENDYVLSEKSVEELVQTSLVNYMSPYENVCDVLNMRDFLQSYLDAALKEEYEQFAKHLDRTPEEVRQMAEQDLSGVPPEFSEEQKARYIEVIRNIAKQCRYSVGIPQKNAGVYHYNTDITYSPNTSITEALTVVQAGTYTSAWDAIESSIRTLEQYTQAPTFGAETTQNVEISLSSMLSSDGQNSALENLCLSIFPIPQ